jgi:hypothetical protein
LRILSRRIVLAIVVAGTCFLVYPLQLAVERPAASGWIGVIWHWFKGLDRPYNLLPSLHITLRTILADLYVRHTRGILRIATHVWFSLIGFSTLLTYQHHTVDVIGGFILATFCFYFVGDVPLRLPVVAATWPYGAIPLWPIISVALVTAGYFALGPSIFRKQAGRLPLSSRIIMGPVILGQYLSLVYYKRQCHAWDAVARGVWIGRRLSDAEAEAAVRAGVSAVVDLSGEFSEARPFLQVDYRHLPVLDLTAPTQFQLAEAAAFIEEQANKGIVYVHCKIGYSRSAAAVGAWLLASGRAANAADAISQMRAARPAIVIRPEIQDALNDFEHRLSADSRGS